MSTGNASAEDGPKEERETMRITNLNGQNIPYHYKGLYRLECWSGGQEGDIEEYYDTKDSAVNAGKKEYQNFGRIRVMVGESIVYNLK